MKAVIDTNVLVSGLFWKGPPADILAAWLADKFEWIVSANILAEYHRTLQALETKYSPSASAWDFLRGVSLSANLLFPRRLMNKFVLTRMTISSLPRQLQGEPIQSLAAIRLYSK